jgi:hypothetical protein
VEPDISTQRTFISPRPRRLEMLLQTLPTHDMAAAALRTEPLGYHVDAYGPLLVSYRSSTAGGNFAVGLSADGAIGFFELVERDWGDEECAFVCFLGVSGGRCCHRGGCNWRRSCWYFAGFRSRSHR